MDKKTIIALSITTSAILVSAVPVLAQTATTTRGEKQAQHQEQNLKRIKDRANQEIDRRIQGLNKLIARLQDMRRVSDSDKNALTATVQAQISALNALKLKINADTDSATLRTDVQSITKAYRIYALVIPQGHIMAMADRINTIADTLSLLESKLESRVAPAKTAGKDVTAMQTALADMKQKIADAKTQAQAAISEVSGLKPDLGDNAQLHANKQALADARKKVQAGNQDLKMARHDADTMVRTFRQLKLEEAASSTPEREK